MASPCRIVADDAQLAAEGRRLVDELERRLTRFRDDSEISTLNRSTGALCLVTPLTYRLLALAQAAREATGGMFNPLVLDRLESIERGDERIDVGPISQEPIELFAVPGGIDAVRLPPGTRFDPGGIAKGLIGDIVVAHLIAGGATAVQVELGGDVRTSGDHWCRTDWAVEVSDPFDRSRRIARLTMPAGAVATSSIVDRTWRHGDTTLHPLIDPTTGAPSATDLASVTAIGDQLWWTEVVAKVALMAGSGGAHHVLRTHGMGGVVVDRDGQATVIERRIDRDIDDLQDRVA